MKPTTTKPALVIAKPAAITCRPPRRWANLGTKGATATSPTVAGSVARPASNGEKSSVAGFWKYRLSRYINALIVPAPIRMASVQPTSTRLRSRARSSRGTLTRFSTVTKAIPAATVITAQIRVSTDTQPQSPLLLTPRMSGIRVSAMSTVPA